MTTLKLENVSFSYNEKRKILDKVNFEFESGKMSAIVGKSGSGKTTLLSILAGLNKVEEGSIVLNETSLSFKNISNYRRAVIGVVFQQFNLLPHLNAVENIELSMRISGKKYDNKRKEALELLKQVGLDEEKAYSRILKLSGGEQQRVAIARALSIQPDIILADEPTGNLDKVNRDIIIEIFRKLAHVHGKCVIIVTHSDKVSKSCDKVYTLE